VELLSFQNSLDPNENSTHNNTITRNGKPTNPGSGYKKKGKETNDTGTYENPNLT